MRRHHCYWRAVHFKPIIHQGYQSCRMTRPDFKQSQDENSFFSECPRNVNGMFTEIRFRALFCDLSVSDRNVSVTIQYFFNFQGTKVFHQIRGFKVPLLWNTTHEINKKWEKFSIFQSCSEKTLTSSLPDPMDQFQPNFSKYFGYSFFQMKDLALFLRGDNSYKLKMYWQLWKFSPELLGQIQPNLTHSILG